MRRIRTIIAVAATAAGLLVVPAVTQPAAALDNGLARTPYLGWNTYYGLGTHFNEQTIKAEADAIVSRGLKAAGYRYVWLDGGWWNGSRAADGTITVDPNQWPDGMKAVADYIHSNGLLAGIYTDAGSTGCGGGDQGSYGHYQQDANTFAAWGFDAVKVDFCGGTAQQLDPAVAYGKFRDALLNNSSHRPMLFNICNPMVPEYHGVPYDRSAYVSYRFGPSTGNSWRTYTDIGFSHSIQWADVLRNYDKNALHPEAAGPGHWNDPDYLGPELGMTPAEAQAQFSLWAVAAAPLIIGSDVRALSQQTIDMLTNRDVLAIDQDPLGVQGTAVSTQGDGQVWVKPLANGDRAVALLNRGDAPLSISTTATAVGLGGAGAYVEHNLWTGDVTQTAARIGATVAPNSVVLLRVSAGTPAGIAPATELTAPQVAATPGTPLLLVTPDTATPVTATFTDDGRTPVTDVRLEVDVPAGWTVAGETTGGTVAPGSSLDARWTVTPPAGTLPGRYVLTDYVTYTWDGRTSATRGGSLTVVVPDSPPSGATYLSDHTWLSATSGWRTPQLDQSVGGGSIRMGGTSFAKGIGVASPSRVDYFLGGNCTRLSGTVGIDDAVNNVGPEGGTATFAVVADAQPRYESGLVDRTATHTFDVDLTGVRVLSLQVGDGGDGGYNDRADWAGLQLTCGAPPATVPAGAWPRYVPQSQLTATATSAHDGYPASAAVDGRLATIWHDEFAPQAPLPQALNLDIGSAQRVGGLTYQPRLDGTSTGTITEYRVEVSTDGTSFVPVATGSWADDSSLKSVSFPPASARYVRLVALAGDGGYASAAEVRVAVTS
jgi:alpha-galactosidase